MRTSLQKSRSVQKWGGGGAPDAGAEIPVQPEMKTMVRQAVPLQPTEFHDGSDIHRSNYFFNDYLPWKGCMKKVHEEMWVNGRICFG